MWIVASIGAILAAFILWNAISPQLPKGLRLPETESHSRFSGSRSYSLALSVGAGQWTALQDGANLRLSREFATPIRSNTVTFYPPVLHLSCYGGVFYAWIDTRLLAQEDPLHPGTVAVRANDGRVEQWTRGERGVLVAPEPQRLVKQVSEAPHLKIRIAFEEAPEQSLVINTDGIDRFAPQLQACDRAVHPRRPRAHD